MGGQIGWLLPAALIAVVAGLFIAGRAPRTDTLRAAVLLWGGWLVVTAATFSYMNGIVHPYYTVALAPAVASGSSASASSALEERRTDFGRRPRCRASSLITTVAQFRSAAQGIYDWLPWLRWAVLVVGLAGGLLLTIVGRWSARPRRRWAPSRWWPRWPDPRPTRWPPRPPRIAGPSRRRAPARASADRRDSSTPAGPAPS